MKKEEIKQWASEVGIDSAGLAEARDVVEFLPPYEKRIRENCLSDVGGVGELTRRLRVSAVMPTAKTVIAVALSYHHPLKEPASSTRDKRGMISAHVFKQDYHQVMQQKMQQLIAKIDRMTQSRFSFQSYCDTGILDDRIWAYKAGIGFFGKNNFIIHPSFGSYLFLGHILTDMPIDEYDVPIESMCEDCTACIDACETGALQAAYELNAKKCISNLTQKKSLAEEEKKLLGHHIYGCDVCQQACPINRCAPSSAHACFASVSEDIYVSCDEIIGLGETGFCKKYGDTALYWRGYHIIKRNAEIVKQNMDSEEKR